jgi:RHS repeat-associated protein
MDNFNCYAYDAESRLVSTVPQVSPGVCAATTDPHAMNYLYDADGRRVAKLHAGQTVEQYYYDAGGQMITEANADGTTARAEIYAGSRHLATWSNNATYFNHADWLGTERVRTNSAGTVCETITSLPFGDGQITQPLNGGCGDPSPNHFTGKQRDYESGLDFFGLRYLSNAQGRWLSADKIVHPSQSSVGEANFIADPQRWNMYAYVLNNPLEYTDANGAEAGLCYSCGQGGQTLAPGEGGWPQDNHPVRDTLMLGAATAGGLFGGQLMAAGRALWTAAVGYFLTPQGQQTAQTAIEALAPPGSNLSLNSAFGFRGAVQDFGEGFSVGRLGNGAEVAARFEQSGSNLTAAVVGAYNADPKSASGTLSAIFQGAQDVAKQQGATSVTIQAVAVANPRLAKLLVNQGFKETTVKIGKETVKAYEKTFGVQ